MYARKFAIVGVAFAAIAVTVAVIDQQRNTSSADAIEINTDAGRLLDDSTGIAPIEDVVEFLGDRAEARPSDHVVRVELARALSTQAAQTADLALYEAAQHAAEDALAIKPDDAGARIELAHALQSQHRFAEALEIGQSELAVRPAAFDAMYVVADANYELGNYDVAASTFRTLESNARDAAVVSRLARMAWVDGDSDEATTLAEEALALSGAYSLRPNGMAFYPFQVGHFRFEAGDVGGAIEALEQALAIDPEHAGAMEKLAAIEAATGDYESARARYEQLLAAGPAADLHGSYASVLRELGENDAAAEQEALGLALAFETIDEFPAERRHLAGFFFDRDPAIALELARQDIAERHDVGAYDILAWALHLNGRHDAAAEAIEHALARGTKSATFHYHAGAIAAARGEASVAVGHLRTALEINDRFAHGDADAARALLDELT